MKRTIKLTESDLRKVIKESANKVLTELDWKTYANAAKKRYQQYKENPKNIKAWDSAYDLNRKANARFNDDYVGNMQYDTLGDKLKGKKSAKFHSRFDVRDDDMPRQAIKGYNKGGYEIFSNGKDRYYSNRTYGGGYTTPNKHFRDKEIGDAFTRANNELWDYANGNYDYVEGEGWKLKESINKIVNSILKEGFYDKGYNDHGDLVDDNAYIDSDFMKKVHETDGKRFTDEEIKALHALKSKLGY